MIISHKGKNVLITGGTKGIGLAIAKAFHKSEASLIVTGTKKKPNLRELFGDSNNKICYIQLDFSHDPPIERTLNNIIKNKKIDVLINNAGINRIDSINDIKENDWDFLNKVNLKGPFLITRMISKKMINQKFGKILNIASVFSVVSKKKRASYSSTKWGLVGLTKAVALDLAPYNILVNSLSPGFVKTKLTEQILGKSGMQKISKSIPLKYLADPSEIAKTALFLTSDLNTYITGQNIIIDGGFTSA